MFQILVVDDDKNTRMLFKAVLEAANYSVLTAQDGIEALAIMDDHHVDLVVLDVMMPNMDGYAFTRTVLEAANYSVLTAQDGIEALAIMDDHHVDLVVLDVMMPNMDGYAFTRTLRESNDNLPILMVSAKQLPEDKKQGFLVGTDDYMTKPIDEEEMLLRIKALLRRARIASERRIVVGDVVLDYDSLTVTRKGQTQEIDEEEMLLRIKALLRRARIASERRIVVGDVVLDYDSLTVTRKGQTQELPQKEFLTRIQLMDEIWGADSETGWETVTVHIGRLRKRFEGWPEFEIVSVRGLGYKAVKHL